jgi:cytochrome c oxidase subunit 4
VFDAHGGEYQPLPIKADIGTREVVGYGMNGEESYIDHYGFPFPAIRFKEDTQEVIKLKEKEKGDWKKMTVAEKKELYRSSFCQTLVELKAPTSEWKAILGLLLTCVSVALWGFVWLTTYAYDDLPVTMTDDEHLKAQIQRMIDMRVGPVEGFASNYDYEKNEWKRMP